jgi:outer membrane autotransporter protein
MQTSIRSFRRTTALILAGSIAALLVPRLSAQTTVTYTNGQTDSTARSTTAPNDPTTLTIASGSATQSGVVSGNGAVIKLGAGTTTLSGANTYSGGAVISNGTLNITALTGAGSGTITLGDANTGANNVTLTGNSGTGVIPMQNNIVVANQGSGTATLEVTAQNSQWGGASIQLNRPTTFQTNYAGVGGGYLGKYDSSSVISGNVGTLTVQALSTGKAYVAGNNTFVGTVVLPQGNVWTFHQGAFGGSGNSVIMSGTAGLALYDADLAIGALTGVSGNTINTSALGSNVLTISSANSATFAGVVSGTGGIIKDGSGTQTLSGANTYTSTTTINGGRLTVNGSIASANVFINPGGTLGGTGNVMGHVTSSGFVSPGNSPGTLTIGGNYTQLGNGTLQIAVAGAQPGQFSVLAVGGKAMLAGTLQVVKENGASLKAGDRLKIVTAVGGVSGVFSTTINPFATGTMLGIQVIYEPNDVLLAFTQSSFAQFAALAGLPPNQTAVARVLDQIVADPRAAEVIAYLNGRPLSNVPGYLDMLNPEELTLVFHLAKSLANVQTANIQSRLAEIRGELEQILSINSVNFSIGGSRRVAPPTPPVNDERWSLWIVGSGEFTRVGSTSNAAGFDLDSGGVTAGVDYRFTEHFVAGISLGYMNTTASIANGGKVDVNGGRVGAYATYFDRGFYVDASVSGGPNSYNTRRTTPNNTTATANPGGTEVNLFLASGYDWKKGPLTFGPIASIQYTNVQLDGFTETGGFAPLSVIRKNADSMRSAIGFHASYDMKVGRAIVRPEARVSWQHEFGDTSYSLTSTFATLGGNPFTVAGPATGRDSMLVRAGVSVQWNERLSAYAYYDGELLRQNYSSNNVSVGFRLRF